MSSVGLIPAVSLVIGAVAGSVSDLGFTRLAVALPVACVLSAGGWVWRSQRFTLAALATGFAISGASLASDARSDALRPPLRDVLHAHVGDFDIHTLGPERDHDPIPTRAVLLEDAAVRDGFVSLRARVRAIAPRGHWLNATGGVSLSVSGDAAPAAAAWRAGRTVEAPVSFRRPGRYLNEGVPDFEHDLALDGTTLFGSVKSALLVTVTGYGSLVEETAADLRAYVRRAMGRWVAPHDPIAAGIVTAVLIGDRTGLPIEVRDRLQAAGTYHVIAISGGNIAILAGLVVVILMAAGIRGRVSALITIAVLLFYTSVAAAGPSVWRATMMAVVYFTARAFDHRTVPWQAASVAAALMVVARPLDVRDPGFILTFGATAALLEAARLGHARLPRRRAVAWIAASVAASLATEVALLPVSAQAFSRVTSAGLLLNLVAVPMMGIAQIAGLAVLALSPMETAASVAGWTAYVAARTLIESSALVDVAPWLTMRVPAPGIDVLAVYYVSLAVVLSAARLGARLAGGAGLLMSLALIAGVRPAQLLSPSSADAGFRWTVFDVGQAEAMLLQVGEGTLLIDAGGAPFGNSSFDVGSRVLAPALWAQRVRSLDTLLITHGDPDHVGGARAITDAFPPAHLWEGIEVPAHAPMRELRDAIRVRRGRIDRRRGGESFDWNGARIHVLHPPEPDWERPRVRNDDSVVLEIVYGDVGLLLTGDISVGVEREIAPRLSRPQIRILKVAHHGSRTSTSRELLEAWRPHYAVISAGRGNTFGHPAPDVLRRLESIGATVLRTDLHGQITLETDGRRLDVRTYVRQNQPQLDR